jgi:hypothetical protein
LAAQTAIRKAQKLMMEQWGRNFTPYKKGNKVWLEGTNITTMHPTSKLAPRQHGPFEITEVISDVVYKLKLPPLWRVHDIFHASLLSPYHEMAMHGPNYHNPPPDVINGEPEWEVEEIMGSRKFGKKKKLQYCVRWKGYSTSHNSREPAENVHAPELIKDFENWQRDKRRGMSDKSLPSSPRVISINNIMVSCNSSYNNLGTTLMEQAAINIMQAA